MASDMLQLTEANFQQREELYNQSKSIINTVRTRSILMVAGDFNA